MLPPASLARPPMTVNIGGRHGGWWLVLLAMVWPAVQAADPAPDAGAKPSGAVVAGQAGAEETWRLTVESIAVNTSASSIAEASLPDSGSFGSLVQRRRTSVEYLDRVDDLPHGRYSVHVFASEFERAHSCRDTVVMHLDRTHWRVLSTETICFD